MWLIVLEALGALALFLFLIWWTMFAGRAKGELSGADPHPDGPANGGAAGSSKDADAHDATKPTEGAPGP